MLRAGNTQNDGNAISCVIGSFQDEINPFKTENFLISIKTVRALVNKEINLPYIAVPARSRIGRSQNFFLNADSFGAKGF
jgi:hypothetical protein